MPVGEPGLIQHQDDRLVPGGHLLQNLARERLHDRVADDQRIAQKSHDPLRAHVRAVGLQRQTGRQIHQIGAAHIQHRRDQKRQLAALGLALMRQPLPEFRADAVRDRSDTIHAASPGQL